MNRTEFLQELARELAGMPEEERSQALQFYTEYLEDAGEENTQAVLEELGSPQQLARQLIANCGVPEVPGEDPPAAPAEPQPPQPPRQAEPPQPEQPWAHQEKSTAQWEYHYAYEPSEAEPQAPGQQPRQSTGYEYGYGQQPRQNTGLGNGAWLWIVLAVVTAPVWLGIAGALVGASVGIVVGALGMVLGGIAAIVGGILSHTLSLAGTLVAAGSGLVAIALGLMLAAAIVWCISKLVPLIPRAWHWLQNTLNF